MKGLSPSQHSPAFQPIETRTNPARHTAPIRAIHWLVAGLIIAALIMSALVMPGIREGSPEKVDALRRHMSVGILVFLLTMTRLCVRNKARRPKSLSSGWAWADWLARAVHRLFDGLILTMIASGLGMAILGGLLPVVLGIHGTLPVSLDALPLHTLHRTIGIVLGGLLALHVGGAFYHQIILRDGLIWRMAPGFLRR